MAPVAAVPVRPAGVDTQGPLPAKVQRQPSVDATGKQVLQVKPKPNPAGQEDAKIQESVAKFDGMAQDPSKNDKNLLILFKFLQIF